MPVARNGVLPCRSSSQASDRTAQHVVCIAACVHMMDTSRLTPAVARDLPSFRMKASTRRKMASLSGWKRLAKVFSSDST